MNTFSDEEINELLKNPFVRTVNIDERVDNFWEVNRMWVPSGYQKKGQNEYCPIEMTTDKIFKRYTLGVVGQGLETEDYSVMDTENPYFDVPLLQFLDMYENRMIPIEMTKRQRILTRIKDIGLYIFASIGLSILILMIFYLVFHPVSMPHSLPHFYGK
jgi:hypothetical protein